MDEQGQGQAQSTQEVQIQLPVTKVPASEAKFVAAYPTVEEMTFRGIINSEEEGYALLRAVQILVNSLGASTIIKVVAAVEKNPKLLEQAKMYMPYIGMI